MISIVQNFICTKDERLKVLEHSVISLANTFPNSEFIINYNSTINLDKVYSIYKNNIKNLKFYNNLEPEWANITLSLSNEVKTPYLICLCEDMVVKSTKKNAPHKRLSLDALYKTEWWKERLSEFILNHHKCTHDIPIRDIRKPNFYEGYYDFNNGMARFTDLKCYIPDEIIILEIENVKQNK